VFEQEESSAVTEDAIRFADRRGGIRDATKRECADDAVEYAVGERKALTPAGAWPNGEWSGGTTAAGNADHARIGIDGDERADGRWIAREVESGAEADFEDVADCRP
jgi:hypothetical protein